MFGLKPAAARSLRSSTDAPPDEGGNSAAPAAAAATTTTEAGGTVPWAAEAFYCTECSALCAFDEVVMGGVHKSHSYIYAVEQAKAVRDEVARQAASVHAAVPEFLAKAEHVRERMCDMERMFASQEALVNAQCDCLVARIEARRAQLLSQLGAKRAEKQRAFEDTLASMQASLERASAAIDDLPALSREVDALPPFATASQRGGAASGDDASDGGGGGSSSGGGGGSMRKKTLSVSSASPPLGLGGLLARKREQQVLQQRRRPPPPPLLTPTMHRYVRGFLPLQQALALIQAGSTEMPDLDQVEVTFREALAKEVDRHGKLMVHEAGFRPPSRANYGGIAIPYRGPGAEGADKGLVWWLGTRGLQTAFRNPCQAGMMQVKCSTLFEVGEPAHVAGRDAVACLTKNQKQASVEVTTGLRMLMAVTHVSVRHGSDSDAYGLRSFVVEGRTEDVDPETNREPHYTRLITVDDNSAVSAEPFKRTVFKVNPPNHTAFKAFRLRMTGGNVSSDPSQTWKLCLGGLEFYGLLYSSSLSA